AVLALPYTRPEARPRRVSAGERNKADTDDRAQGARAGPGQGEKKGDDSQAKERAAHRGDYGSGAGEQASEEGRPSARRAIERQKEADGRGHRGRGGEPVVAVLPGHPNGPCDREQRCEGPVVRRETGSGVEQGGNHRDDADREHPHGGEARSEELHPGSDDQEAAGREDLEEVAIEYLATKDPRGAVEKDAFIAEPEDVAKDGGAHRARDQRDGVEQRIAEEGRTRSGFEAGTSAHGVSMQGRSHRRFPFPTQSTFALVECEAFLGGGVG